MNGYRHGSLCGILVADRLNIVQSQCRLHCAMHIHNLFQNLLQILLLDKEVNLRKQSVLRDASVDKTEILRNNFVEEQSSDSCIDDAFQHLFFTVFGNPFFSHLTTNLRMQGYKVILISKNRFVYRLKEHSLSGVSLSFLGQIIHTQYHILRRYGNHTAVGRL